MAVKADTLRKDTRQATRDVMAGKHDLPAVKVCTCTQYSLFLAIQLIYQTESAGHSSILFQYMYLIQCLLFRWRLKTSQQLKVQSMSRSRMRQMWHIRRGCFPKKTEEEHWVLRQNTMVTFNTIFQGYQFINKGFMDLSKLIDGTPLNAMGQILNDIQESAARLGRGRRSGSGGGEGKKEG